MTDIGKDLPDKLWKEKISCFSRRADPNDVIYSEGSSKWMSLLDLSDTALSYTCTPRLSRRSRHITSSTHLRVMNSSVFASESIRAFRPLCYGREEIGSFPFFPSAVTKKCALFIVEKSAIMISWQRFRHRRKTAENPKREEEK